MKRTGDRDPARYFLEQAVELRLEAARRERRVLELDSRCRRVTSRMGQGTAGGDRSRILEEIWTELADERNRERDAVKRELEGYQAVEDFIDRLEEPVHRAILRLRYLDGLNWVQVQQRLYRQGLAYSDRHITRLHKRALEEAAELLEEEKKMAEKVPVA